MILTVFITGLKPGVNESKDSQTFEAKQPQAEPDEETRPASTRRILSEEALRG